MDDPRRRSVTSWARVTTAECRSSCCVMDANCHETNPLLDEAWRAHRGRALDVAYRMLGSIADAQDVVGEAYVRLAQYRGEAILDLRGWLVTVTSRLCLDRLRSAEVQRRAYVGPWLPEPIVGTGAVGADPADRVTLDDTVRMALLVVLEQLSAAERTVFVLADVFSLGFDEIAAIVGRSPAACRQLAVRARARVAADGAARFRTEPSVQRRVAEEFARACAAGDLGGLIAVLDSEVTGDFDSGGFIPGAPLDVAVGPLAVATLLRNAFAGSGAVFEVDAINGEPGVTVTLAGRVVAVIALEVRGGRVMHVHGIGNPDKLPAVAEPIVGSSRSQRPVGDL